MKRTITTIVLATAAGLAGAAEPADPIIRASCESNCIEASAPIHACAAGRDRAEVAAMKALIGHAGAETSLFEEVADEFVQRCTKTCVARSGDSPSLFRAQVATSKRVPLMCRYDWTWCVGEDGASCQPALPEIDEAAYFESAICSRGSGPICLSPVQMGQLAGCHYILATGAHDPWQNADFAGFQCANGLLHGTGTVELQDDPRNPAEPERSRQNEWGELVRGFRTGEWVLESRNLEHGSKWTRTYSVLPHGPYEINWSNGEQERGHYDWGVKHTDRREQP